MEKRIKSGKYNFPDTEWSGVSYEAKALIDQMLETDPERRITINQIMNSKWIMVNLLFHDCVSLYLM